MAKFGSQEWKDNISKGNKGKIPWNKGKNGLQISWRKGIKMSVDEIEKNRISHLGQQAWNKGKHWGDDIKSKISKSNFSFSNKSRASLPLGTTFVSKPSSFSFSSKVIEIALLSSAINIFIFLSILFFYN